jgi:hypothetical protein
LFIGGLLYTPLILLICPIIRFFIFFLPECPYSVDATDIVYREEIFYLKVFVHFTTFKIEIPNSIFLVLFGHIYNTCSRAIFRDVSGAENE